MASIEAQLKVIRSSIQAPPEKQRGPQTRPSILYDSKEAADIDIRTLLPIALSGLDALIELDARFSSYKNTLFNQTSLELDREQLNQKENDKLNKSITSYLRLLSGNLLQLAARKTLEYLIRRYSVHVYNMEELVLCALPYHDTHVFVQIVQLIKPGNTKWGFLEGVKGSGAPPPRHTIVQQCLCDKGLLETICNYASANKDFNHSRPVISFCTAIIVESLGQLAKLDTDTVQRVLGVVFTALNPLMKSERDHKAGALMVIGLLGTKSTLAPKLIQNLLLSVAKVAENDANESLDLPWLRVTTMAMISLVQSQPVHVLGKKPVLILAQIRDFAGILSELSSEYNIQKFINLYLESLIECSTSEDSCWVSLVNIIETVPLKSSIEKISNKILAYCAKIARSNEKSNSTNTGKWAKKILSLIEKHYPSELRGSIRKFLQNNEMHSKKGESISEILTLLLDKSEESGTTGTAETNLWFSLEHPKAEVRKKAMKEISESGLINTTSKPHELVNLQDAIIRGLSDKDLTVVQAALSIKGISSIFNSTSLFKSLQNVLSNCIDMLDKSGSNASKAADVAVSCLAIIVEFQSNHVNYANDVASLIFPLLVIRSKTWKVNVKALELIKEIKISFFTKSSFSLDPITFDNMKNVDSKCVVVNNNKIIEAFSNTLISSPKENIEWLVESGKENKLSKNLFLLIVLRALFLNNQGFVKLMEIYTSCFPYLKKEWSAMEPSNSYSSLHGEEVEKFCTEVANTLFTTQIEELNYKALISIFWSLLKASSSSNHFNSDEKIKRESMLGDLFSFFCTVHSKNSFEKHLQYLLTNCTDNNSFKFLSKYFAEDDSEVQIESLNLYANLGTSSERTNFDENFHCQLLTGLPLLLIPLSHTNKDIRMCAMNCVESLLAVWRRFNTSFLKNGNNSKFPQCLLSPTFGMILEALVDQKYMICSDVKFLCSYLPSMLSSSNLDLVVPHEIQNRFDQSAKDSMLVFFLNSLLTFSSYGKFMVLSLLKGMGNALFKVENFKQYFLNLIEKRNTLITREVDILCLLLEVSLSASSVSEIGTLILDSIVQVVRLDNFSSTNDYNLRPIFAILEMVKPSLFDSLNIEIQDKLFSSFILLLRNENAEIRNAARETLLRLNLNYSTIRRLIDVILSGVESSDASKRSKRKKKDQTEKSFFGLFQDPSRKDESRILVLASLLDILLLKKDLVQRVDLVKPLLRVLAKLFDSDAIEALFGQLKSQNQNDEENTFVLYQARQLTLLVLKDIVDSMQTNLPQEESFNKGDIELLIECARSSVDASTRNHVFVLISSLSRICPDLVSDNIISIFSVIGESALKQDDTHSQHVVEDLIATLVPCWLARTSSVEELLQIFITALPDLPEHRRLVLLVYLSKTLGEDSSLGTTIYLLLNSLSKNLLEPSTHQEIILNKMNSPTLSENWEFKLALKLCEHYPCKIWFPSLINMLKETESHEIKGRFWNIFLSLRFVLEILQDTELIFQFESQRNSNYLQETLGSLMEQIVGLLQTVISKKKQFKIELNVLKEFHDLVNNALKTITIRMIPSTFFTSITRLIGDQNANIQRKTLAILCETLREENPKKKVVRKSKQKSLSSLFQLDDSSSESFTTLCSKLIQLIDRTAETSSDNIAIKSSSISSFELLATKYPSDIYANSLASITNQIVSVNPVISSSAIRTAGALISVLGSKALPHLPVLMNNTIKSAAKFMDNDNIEGISLLNNVFGTLEIIVEKIGGFLNPYLESVLELVLLRPNLDPKLDSKAISLRKLLTDKIPVRLMLQPLLEIYAKGIKCGEISLSLTFEMLLSLINTMDRASITTYHTKIYEFCLKALNLRHETPKNIKNINLVENSVINALTGLTMRLTEKMFRPLFLQSFEWAENEVDFGSKSTKSFDRAISFYKFVNKLSEQQRSLFVPYYKYLLESCVRYLSGDLGSDSDLVGLKRKKKKAKLSSDAKLPENNDDNNNIQAQKIWHVRYLVMNALHKCFLYDTDQKILDSSNFEVLLKSIVAQMVLEAPVPATSDVPTGEEMDESLVLCLGQMAVTARSDVLWKPLNHEVLMQTRSDKLRPKILGLKVIRYLVQNLKEEYMVFLSETIPFLGELLEDAELSVKSLTQEILKEMETLSGESLREYL